MPTTAELWITLEILETENENSLNDSHHSSIYPRVPINFAWRDMFPLLSIQNFACTTAKAPYPHHPNARTTTRERGNDFQGWANYTEGSTRLTDGETSAGWGAVARSPHGRIFVTLALCSTLCYVMFLFKYIVLLVVSRSLGSIFHGSQIERCGAQWNGQTPLLLLLLRTLLTSMRITFGIP